MSNKTSDPLEGREFLDLTTMRMCITKTIHNGEFWLLWRHTDENWVTWRKVTQDDRTRILDGMNRSEDPRLSR